AAVIRRPPVQATSEHAGEQLRIQGEDGRSEGHENMSVRSCEGRLLLAATAAAAAPIKKSTTVPMTSVMAPSKGTSSTGSTSLSYPAMYANRAAASSDTGSAAVSALRLLDQRMLFCLKDR